MIRKVTQPVPNQEENRFPENNYNESQRKISNGNYQEESEIETKLDVSLHEEMEGLTKKIRSVIQREKWEIVNERKDEKEILYYDTSSLQLHNNGATLRKVTPFDQKVFPGSFRYDFKQGKERSRIEAKGWSSTPLKELEILSLLGLENKIGKIRPIVGIHINPFFLDLKKGEVEAELKVDTCTYRLRPLFHELEIELKKGDPQQIYDVTATISRELRFPYLSQQKYSRVIDLLGIRGWSS